MNILANGFIQLIREAPLLPQAMIDRILNVAAKLIDDQQANLPFATFFTQAGWLLVRSLDEVNDPIPDYSVDPITWTYRQLLLPALNYHLMALASVSAATAQDGEIFADEVLEFLRQNDLKQYITIPISGIKVAERRKKLETTDAMLYNLTDAEQAELHDQWGFGVPSGRIGFATLPLAALRLTARLPRDEQMIDTRGLVARWLCAFSLHGNKIAGATQSVHLFPVWVAAGMQTSFVNLPSMVNEWRTLRPADFSSIAKTVKQLESFNFLDPRSTADLALHRFYIGHSRQSITDAVVDFTVALESLLLPYDENTRQGELGYRFRMHGAHYLATQRSKRVEMVRKLTDIYSIRSRLVHGGKYPTGIEIQAAHSSAEELARIGLLKAIYTGFPRPEQYRNMLLGM